MIFFDSNQNIKKDSDLYKYLQNTLQNLNKQLDLQENKRNNLTTWASKITDICIDDFKDIDTTNLLSNIDSLKITLDNITTNIEDINQLIISLKDIIENIDNDTKYINLSEYYISYMNKQNSILERNSKLEALYGKIFEYCYFKLPPTMKTDSSRDKNEITTSLTIEDSNLEDTENKTLKNDIPETNLKENTINTIEQQKELSDNNTLTISETQNKVYLPYKISDLKLILEENPDKYDSLEDLINKDYIIPISKYKNPSLSRFRESFILMRHREKASFTKALDLALELVFKYNLNPAVISACKNLDELDIYLDCLDDMSLNDFKIFDIKYEIPPMKV